MIRLTPRSTRTATLFPYTTLIRYGSAQSLFSQHVGSQATRCVVTSAVVLETEAVIGPSEIEQGASPFAQENRDLPDGRGQAPRLQPSEQPHLGRAARLQAL